MQADGKLGIRGPDVSACLCLLLNPTSPLGVGGLANLCLLSAKIPPSPARGRSLSLHPTCKRPLPPATRSQLGTLQTQ
eukprot:5457095-Pyramimonas_sp.AAC.1